MHAAFICNGERLAYVHAAFICNGERLAYVHTAIAFICIWGEAFLYACCFHMYTGRGLLMCILRLPSYVYGERLAYVYTAIAFKCIWGEARLCAYYN